MKKSISPNGYIYAFSGQRIKDNITSSAGIVPVTCEELFKGIEEKQGSGIEFQVSFSMLEIYSEQVCVLSLLHSFLKKLVDPTPKQLFSWTKDCDTDTLGTTSHKRLLNGLLCEQQSSFCNVNVADPRDLLQAHTVLYSVWLKKVPRDRNVAEWWLLFA